jgi:predicted small secreted protein
MRKQGDTIRFRVMPWVNPDGQVYEGKITRVCQDDEGDYYYHVDAQIGSERVEDGLVLEREVQP